MKDKAYARAGVDIALGNQVKATLPRLLASTHRPEVLGKIGGFGGLFAFDHRKYRQPVLVSSVDGVGTKLKLAFAMDRHDTIGQDLVNHCVNDIAVLGAEPLFFLDYIGTGKLQPRVFAAIIKGFAAACAQNRCALIGGETAQMPGFYQPGEYDLSGTIVGVVEKSKILDGRTIRPGDAVIGLASSGLHTNGYSLARKILFDQMKWKPRTYVPELRNTIGNELLKVHVSYGPLVLSLLKRFNPQPAGLVRAGLPRRSQTSTAATKLRSGTVVRIPSPPLEERARERRPLVSKFPSQNASPEVGPGRLNLRPAIGGLAHITGGGFIDNIPRVLPKNCDVIIRKGSWPLPPIFRLLQDQGRVPEAELYQVFNMGIGMTAIVRSNRANEILQFIRAQKQRAWLIGEVRQGRGLVRME